MSRRTIPSNVDVDRAHQLAVQLQALLAATYGGGHEAFASLNDTMRENFLWACADIAGRLVDALDARVEVA